MTSSMAFFAGQGILCAIGAGMFFAWMDLLAMDNRFSG
jgi:hypothetical protein